MKLEGGMDLAIVDAGHGTWVMAAHHMHIGEPPGAVRAETPFRHFRRT